MADTFKIQSTKIVGIETKRFVVEMILSSDTNLDEAADVVQIRASLPSLNPITEPPRLVTLQLSALEHVQTLINGEIHRLPRFSGNTS